MNLGVYYIVSPAMRLQQNDIVLVFNVVDNKDTTVWVSIVAPNGTTSKWLMSKSRISSYLREETGRWGLRSQRKGDTTDGQ
jgi:hypothetical protein